MVRQHRRNQSAFLIRLRLSSTILGPSRGHLFVFTDALFGRLRRNLARPVNRQQVAQTWHLDSADEFFRAFYDASVRTKALPRAQSAQALAMIRREIELSLRPYKRAGRIEIPMAAVLASARKSEPSRRRAR